MNDNDQKHCMVMCLCASKDMGQECVDMYKMAQKDCKGPKVDYMIHVAGEKCEKCKCNLLCLCAKSQDDWEKVKSAWEKDMKDKCEAKMKCVCACSDEDAKKWAQEVGADMYMNMSDKEHSMECCKHCLEKACHMKCDDKCES